MLNPGLSGLNGITGYVDSEAPRLRWESEAAVLRVNPAAADADVQPAPSRAGKVEEGPGPRGLQTVEAAGDSLGASGERAALPPLQCRPRETHGASDPPDCKNIHLCCFKPLSLW